MIESQSILVLAPHPDDEVLGCGGTLALASESGARVHVLVVFDGAAGDPDGHFESSTYAQRRRREALAAGERIGVSGYTFWELPEGHWATEAEIDAGALRLQALIAELRPEVVLAPWEGDGHRDHQTVARTLRRVLERNTDVDFEAFGFEVWTPLRADHLVDVSSVWQRKVAALREHETQLAYSDLVEQVTSLATRHQAGWLEAFSRFEVNS